MIYNDYIDRMPDGVYDAINMAHSRSRACAHAHALNNNDDNYSASNDRTRPIDNSAQRVSGDTLLHNETYQQTQSKKHAEHTENTSPSLIQSRKSNFNTRESLPINTRKPLNSQTHNSSNMRVQKKTLPGGKAVGLGYDGVRGARVCTACIHQSSFDSTTYYRTITQCGKGNATILG